MAEIWGCCLLTINIIFSDAAGSLLAKWQTDGNRISLCLRHGTINSKDSVAGGGGIKNSIFMKKGQLIKILVNNKAQNIGKMGFSLK